MKPRSKKGRNRIGDFNSTVFRQETERKNLDLIVSPHSGLRSSQRGCGAPSTSAFQRALERTPALSERQHQSFYLGPPRRRTKSIPNAKMKRTRRESVVVWRHHAWESMDLQSTVPIACGSVAICGSEWPLKAHSIGPCQARRGQSSRPPFVAFVLPD